jgi:hypothetical protein
VSSTFGSARAVPLANASINPSSRAVAECWHNADRYAFLVKVLSISP